MIVSFMTDSVDILRPGADVRDSRGNVLPGPTTETTVDFCAVLPPSGQTAPTTELADGRQTVTIVRVLFAPAGTDLRPMDRVRHAGRLYEVDGEPNTFGVTAVDHVEVNLRAVTG
jgi:hypothetical protein